MFIHQRNDRLHRLYTFHFIIFSFLHSYVSFNIINENQWIFLLYNTIFDIYISVPTSLPKKIFDWSWSEFRARKKFKVTDLPWTLFVPNAPNWRCINWFCTGRTSIFISSSNTSSILTDFYWYNVGWKENLIFLLSCVCVCVFVSFVIVTKTRLFNILLSVIFSSSYSQHWYHFSWLLLIFLQITTAFPWDGFLIYFSSSIFSSSYILKISLFVVTNGLI